MALRAATMLNRRLATGVRKLSTPAEATLPDLSPRTTHMNTVGAINAALHTALQTDPTATVFGEDVAFGGVFRATNNLQAAFGSARVFNTPLCEQGILGFAIGLAATEMTAIAEIQFADYIFPAFDQLVNEAAKMRFRSGGSFACPGLTVRAPCGAVGHGGLYHSQSPEAYLCHTPGLRVVTCRDPQSAKGLLLAAIRAPDPVVFLEPKALYRACTGNVPDEDYELPLGKADVVREGCDATLLGWGTQVHVLSDVADAAKEELGVECEVVDLQSLLPWDEETVIDSVRKTGRLLVAHEAPITCGLGAEIAASVQDACFLSLKSPVQRVAGFDTPFPLAQEKLYLPSKQRCLDALKQALNF